MGSLGTAVAGEDISDTLTLIVTTSPTPSAPSTELLSAILISFQEHCPILLKCEIIIVLDTFERIGEVARLKKGQVTEQGAADNDQYRANVKDLILSQYFPGQGVTPAELHTSLHEAEYGYQTHDANNVIIHSSQTADGRVTFLEPTRRLGFGLAVRSALRIAKTPYVWIQQHDWALAANIPVEGILDVMSRHNHDHDDDQEELNGSTDPNADYTDSIHSSAAAAAAAAPTPPPPPVRYVCLPSVRMLGYATSAHVGDFPALRNLTASLQQSFPVHSQPGTCIPLTPMFFWHDKPHIVFTEHYLSRVFPTRLAIPRGAFIEDTIGQRGRNQMKEGMWARWACWLYYPDEGRQLCLRHLQGRTWLGAEGEIEKGVRYKERNLRESGRLMSSGVGTPLSGVKDEG